MRPATRIPRIEAFHPVARTSPGVRLVVGYLTRVSADGPYDWPTHIHDHFELIAVESGTYRCRIDDEDVSLPAGRHLIIRPGDRHRDLLTEPVRYTGVGFRIEGGRRGSSIPLFDAVAPPRQRIVALGGTVLQRIIDGLVEAAHSREIASDRLLEARIGELVWMSLRVMPAGILTPMFREQARNEQFTERLYRLFQDRLATPPSVAEMASACGMGATQLGERCHSLLQMSPVQAFRVFRLEAARLQLEHGHQAVQRVARNLGFADPFHFSRIYKQHFGHAPSGTVLRSRSP